MQEGKTLTPMKGNVEYMQQVLDWGAQLILQHKVSLRSDQCLAVRVTLLGIHAVSDPFKYQ